jgi:hypothetical protein
MEIKFIAWLKSLEEGTALLGTTGTQPGEPTPSGSAPKNKVSAPDNSGNAGGPGKSIPPNSAGCSGGPCPPKNTVTPLVMGGGGGGGGTAGASAIPAQSVPVK